tara:strand:- start:3 stop:602 length:600 start_codon:yes stop_codon:yes gene_type:complete
LALFGKDKKDSSKLPPLPSNPAVPPAPVPTPPKFAPKELPTPPSFTGGTPSAAPITPTPVAPTPTMPSGGDLSKVAGEKKEHTELLTEDVEKIVQSVVNDKWEPVKENVNSIEAWKSEVDNQLGDFKNQLAALDKKLSDAQNAIMGKVDDYNKSLGDVNVEIQAMGKVFEKVIPQFTDNVNRLSEMVEKKGVKRVSKKK